MISEDSNIAFPESEARKRMNEYAQLFEELHVVLPNHSKRIHEKMGNLFIYYAGASHKIVQKIKLFFLANKIVTHNKFDVISVQNPAELGIVGLFIQKTRRIPLVVQVHTDIFSFWYRHSSFIDRIRYWLALWIIPRADRVRVVSERIKKSMIEQSLLSSEKITVLPIYTDTSLFTNAIPDIQTSERFSEYSFKMVSVGRFVDKEKNFNGLIKVMRDFVKTCPQALLVIVGDGPDLESLKSKVKSLKLDKNVILEGWRDDLPSFLKSFDLFVMPSNYEGWGRVVIEAMASSLPILMTDVGLAGEIVGNEKEGMVVPVGDKQELLKAMICLYNDKDMLKRFKEFAVKKVLEMKLKTQKEYLELYKKSLEF